MTAALRRPGSATAKRGSLTAQSLVLAGATASAQTLFAVLVTVAARRCGPAEFGLAAIALGVGAFLTGLLDYGFTAYSLRELSAGRMHPSEYWVRMRTKAALALLVVGALLGLGYAVSHPYLAGMVGLVTVSRVLLLGVGIPLRATHRVGRAAAVILVEKASWLAGFAFLLAAPVDPLAAFWWSMAVATVIATAAGLALAGGARALLGGVRLSSPWSGEAGYGLFSLAVSLSLLDVALLGLAGGSPQAGGYGALSRWTQPVLLLSQTFSAAATPFIAGAHSSRAAVRAIRGSLWIPALSFAICLAMAALAPMAVPLLLGPAYADAAPALAILAAGAAAVVATQPLSTFLQARGHARLVGRSTMVTVLLQLGGVWLTAGALGATGAALAYALSQLLLLLVLATGGVALTTSRRRDRAVR